MNQPETICFKLQPIKKTVIAKNIKPVSWSKCDLTELQQSFINQVNNNFLTLKLLKHSCLDDSSKVYTILNNQLTQVASTEEICDKFLNIISDYQNLFKLDDQALLQPNFNVDLYVIILIYNNLYYGHIYT